MKKIVCNSSLVVMMTALGLVGCSKDKAPAEDPSSVAADSQATPTEASDVDDDAAVHFVEGVAGGVMVRKIEFQAEVVSVDQEAREVVLRAPDDEEVKVRVGENAVNFYQLKAGDRVNVLAARELAVYVPGEEEAAADGTSVEAATSEKGDKPAGVVVSTTKVTANITALDKEEREATLKFETGEEETFVVRPDVDLSQYEVGQEVVFLFTELLAMEVEAL